MKELKNKKITIAVLIVITYIAIYYLFNIWSDGIYARFRYNIGLEVFYRFYDYIPGYLLLGFMTTCFVAETFHLNKQSKFQNYIIARVGHKERMKYEIKQVLITSFFINLIFNICLLVMIHLFFSNVVFKEYTDASLYAFGVDGLYPNAKISFILYLLYSSIGFSIFSLFIYSVSYFIKNQYFYKISGIVLFIGMTVLLSLIGNQLYVYYTNIKLANPILEAIATLDLVTPGISGTTAITTLSETHIYFWYTCICFLIYSSVLLLIRFKLEKKYG